MPNNIQGQSRVSAVKSHPDKKDPQVGAAGEGPNRVGCTVLFCNAGRI